MYNVTVIVPVYNVEQYIEKCLTSLKNQTMKSLEVIIVNDGTKDESRNIAEAYIAKNNLSPRFHIIDKENGGLSDARNFALPYVNGKYVCFLDSDDFVEPTLYEKMFNQCEKYSAKFCQCGYYLDYGNKKKKVLVPKTNSINELAAYGIVVAWNKMFLYENIKNNNLLFPVGLYFEDIYFFYNYLQTIKTSDIVTIDEPLIHYVQRNDSIMAVSSKKVLDIISIYSQLQDNEFKNEIEYRCSRNLNASFYKKAKRIENKEERNLVFKEFKSFLSRTYPKWKKNKYYKSFKLKDFVIRYIIPFKY